MASFKVVLPPVAAAVAAKKEDKKPSPKPKHKLPGKKPAAPSRGKHMRFRREKAGQRTALGNDMELTREMVDIRILQRLSKAKMNSLGELRCHSHFLLEKNRWLKEDIQEKDIDTARRAGELLQQYDMFGTIIATLQDSTQNQVGVVKAELQEAEKMVKKNTGKLEQELSRMNAKVCALQEELNVLRTYMDKEFPVKSVQIASLLRSIQNLNEEQQDELEETEEMARQFLKTIMEKTKKETEHILQAVVEEKVLEYEWGLQRMARNNQELMLQIQMQKKVIENLGREIEALQKNIGALRKEVRHPRDVIFEDILLQRPICTPEMEVILNIPTEEKLPF